MTKSTSCHILESTQITILIMFCCFFKTIFYNFFILWLQIFVFYEKNTINYSQTSDVINEQRLAGDLNTTQSTSNIETDNSNYNFITYSTLPNIIKFMELLTFVILILSGTIKLSVVEQIITIISIGVYIILFYVLIYNVIDLVIVIGVRENDIELLLSINNIFLYFLFWIWTNINISTKIVFYILTKQSWNFKINLIIQKFLLRFVIFFKKWHFLNPLSMVTPCVKF